MTKWCLHDQSGSWVTSEKGVDIQYCYKSRVIRINGIVFLSRSIPQIDTTSLPITKLNVSHKLKPDHMLGTLFVDLFLEKGGGDEFHKPFQIPEEPFS